MTIPLIPFYTPFRAALVIYSGLKNKTNWQKEKKTLEQELITVEPFVESAPQAVIMTAIWAASIGCIGPSRPNIFNWITYITSILAAIFGMMNFLRLGPMSINGLCIWDYLALSITVGSSLCLKGAIVGAFLAPSPAGPGGESYAVLLCFLPGLIVATTTLLLSLGPQKSLSVVAKYPGSILMPVLTTITFGPQPCLKCCCGCLCSRGSKLQLGKRLTAVNAIVTSAAEILAVTFCIKSFGPDGPHDMMIIIILSCAKLVVTIFFLGYLRSREHPGITMNHINSSGNTSQQQQTNQQEPSEQYELQSSLVLHATATEGDIISTSSETSQQPISQEKCCIKTM